MSDPPGSPDGPELFMTEVRADDWAGLVAWYAEALGLRLILRDEPNGFALLSAGSGRLALKRADPTGAARGGHVRLVFRVADVDAERARLSALGVAVSEPADNAREAYREVRLTDPEGTPITLFAWVPNARPLRPAS